jgi:hypothetical protein
MTYVLLATTAISVIALSFVAFSIRRASRAYMTFHGQRIVSCPETHKPAAVRVAAGKAAFNAAIGKPTLGLCDCSRWPERSDCPQDCLAQIKEAPGACLVWNIMNRWYHGQECAFCHKGFTEIHWHDHPPALVDAERHSVLWNEVPAERLQETMRTHVPVCWNCYVAETFRQKFPNLVVDRPAH